MLPSHVVYTLPAEELAIFGSPRLRDGLTRSLQRAVHQRAAEYVARLRRVHGGQMTTVGGDLRVSMLEGEGRDVEARFEGPRAAERPRPGRPTVLDRPPRAGARRADGTEPDGDLRMVLRSGGVLVGEIAPTTGRMLVGRDLSSTLVVPQEHEKVSRQALVVSRSGVTTIDAEVVNRNGAWLTSLAAADRTAQRSHVPRGERVTLRVGERVDLDQAAQVTVALESRSG